MPPPEALAKDDEENPGDWDGEVLAERVTSNVCSGDGEGRGEDEAVLARERLTEALGEREKRPDCEGSLEVETTVEGDAEGSGLRLGVEQNVGGAEALLLPVLSEVPLPAPPLLPEVEAVGAAEADGTPEALRGALGVPLPLLQLVKVGGEVGVDRELGTPVPVTLPLSMGALGVSEALVHPLNVEAVVPVPPPPRAPPLSDTLLLGHPDALPVPLAAP